MTPKLGTVGAGVGAMAGGRSGTGTGGAATRGGGGDEGTLTAGGAGTDGIVTGTVGTAGIVTGMVRTDTDAEARREAAESARPFAWEGATPKATNVHATPILRCVGGEAIQALPRSSVRPNRPDRPITRLERQYARRAGTRCDAHASAAQRGHVFLDQDLDVAGLLHSDRTANALTPRTPVGAIPRSGHSQRMCPRVVDPPASPQLEAGVTPRTVGAGAARPHKQHAPPAHAGRAVRSRCWRTPDRRGTARFEGSGTAGARWRR